jgi:predicted DNA-binding transcriptional regulator AlpA
MTDSTDLIKIEEVCRMLGHVTKATVYARIKRGDVPEPIKITPGTSRWRRSEIEQVINRMANRRTGTLRRKFPPEAYDYGKDPSSESLEKMQQKAIEIIQQKDPDLARLVVNIYNRKCSSA